MAGEVNFILEDGIGFVRLCNPERRNALNGAMWEQLTRLACSCADRDDLRAILVSGEGDRAFCAGADITGFEETRSDAAGTTGYDDMVEEACRALEAVAQPTIALLKGACMGAGVSLAASCDLRVASHDAFFAIPAARLGLGYDPRGIERLCRVFGENFVRLALFSAQRIPAAHAHATGAVHAMAEPEQVDGVAAALVRSVADNAPLTIRAAKLAIRARHGQDPDTQTEAMRLYAAADASADYVEGRKAFRERRLPKFIGR